MFQYAGGLVGYNQNGTISNSYAAGSVEAMSIDTRTESDAGGLVGVNVGTISNSYVVADSVEATATGSNTVANAGGLVGNNNSGTISNSYVAADSVATGGSTVANAGGLVGNNNGGTIGNTNYHDITTEPANGCGSGMCSAVPLTTTEMQATSGTYPDMLGDAFSLGDGYPKLYKCEIDPATNACVADSFLPEPVPGQ